MKITIREAIEVRVEGINNDVHATIRNRHGFCHEANLGSYEPVQDLLEYAGNTLYMDKQELVLARQEMPSREEVINISNNILRIDAEQGGRLPSCLSKDMIEVLVAGGQITFDMGEETLTYRMEVTDWNAVLKCREYSIEHQTPEIIRYFINFEYETIEREVR